MRIFKMGKTRKFFKEQGNKCLISSDRTCEKVQKILWADCKIFRRESGNQNDSSQSLCTLVVRLSSYFSAFEKLLIRRTKCTQCTYLVQR